MATSPPRYTSLLLASLLLVLLPLLAFSHAAPEPASRQLVVQVDDIHGDQVDGAGTGEEAAVSYSTAAADERCGYGEKEEECLMRRTLVAHTDYIYTQGGDHN